MACVDHLPPSLDHPLTSDMSSTPRHPKSTDEVSLSTTIIDIVPISIPQIPPISSSTNHITPKRKSLRNPSMADVSRRIKQRKYLHNRLYVVSNAMCFIGLLGIILMIIENEITFALDNDDDTIASWFIKLIISISTIILIGLIVYYHQLDLNLYSIRNSVENWRIGLTVKKIFLITSELVICSIHPMPRYLHPNSSSHSITTVSYPVSYISFDVALGLPMFARMYLLCRLMMFHSNLVRNATSQSFGYLNQVSMDFSFLIKTYLEQWPARCLIIFCTIIFFIGSWCLRACDYRPDYQHESILDSMWLFIVTFTTVGYGELTPTTYCGRSIATICALIGISSMALLISVLAQKLVLTRWEKYVHNFVLNIELAKQRKHQAANIIKFAIKVWHLRRKEKSKSIQFIKAQWKLFRSIQLVQEVKQEQRKLIDSCLVLANLFTLRDENDNVEKIGQQMNIMELKIDKIEEKFNDMNQIMNNIQNTLNLLVDRA